MKEVMIILRPKMYFPTKDALDQAGFHSMTIREIIGRGKCPVHYDYDEGAPVKHTFFNFSPYLGTQSSTRERGPITTAWL